MRFSNDLANESLILERCEQMMYISSYLNLEESPSRDWQVYFQELMKSAQMDEKQIKHRIKQLDFYLKLSHITEIVDVLVEIKTKNKIRNDFKFQESDQSNVYKQIKDIDDTSMKNYEKLFKMNETNFINCLKKYCEHMSFVEWLRENAPGNLSLILSI